MHYYMFCIQRGFIKAITGLRKKADIITKRKHQNLISIEFMELIKIKLNYFYLFNFKLGDINRFNVNFLQYIYFIFTKI